MFLFLKSLSRSVHDDQESEETKKRVESTEEGSSSSFTVWRKSLVISCNGFTVINSSGDLVYRVDNYSIRPQQIVLMDAPGNSILTLNRRKKLGVSEKWEVFEGENCTEMAIWSVTKKKRNVLEVFNEKVELVYVIEGSYRKRECKVMDESRRIMAEIKRKEAIIGGVQFGEDVFVLVVHASFCSQFAMALVLLLDHMFS